MLFSFVCDCVLGWPDRCVDFGACYRNLRGTPCDTDPSCLITKYHKVPSFVHAVQVFHTGQHFKVKSCVEDRCKLGVEPSTFLYARCMIRIECAARQNVETSFTAAQ